MNDLPCCKLCKQFPHVDRQREKARCITADCDITEEWDLHVWCKLMYVPERKTGYIEFESDLDINWAIGYNEAIDAMSKGE